MSRIVVIFEDNKDFRSELVTSLRNRLKKTKIEVDQMVWSTNLY